MSCTQGSKRGQRAQLRAERRLRLAQCKAGAAHCQACLRPGAVAWPGAARLSTERFVGSPRVSIERMHLCVRVCLCGGWGKGGRANALGTGGGPGALVPRPAVAGTFWGATPSHPLPVPKGLHLICKAVSRRQGTACCSVHLNAVTRLRASRDPSPRSSARVQDPPPHFPTPSRAPP